MVKGCRKACIPFLGLVLFCLWLVSLGCRPGHNDTAGQHEKVTIASVSLPFSALIHVASLKGYFADEGLDVAFQMFEFGKPALRSVLDGKADIAVVGDTPIMHAVVGGENPVVLAVIATSASSEGVVARKDRGIGQPADLRNRKIGATIGTTGEFFLDSFLAANGIGHNEVKVVDLRPSEIADAFASGKIDAAATWQPVLMQLQTRIGADAIMFTDETIYSEIICIASTQKYAKEHPSAVRKILKALVRAEVFNRQNPEAARRIVADMLKIDGKLLDQVWSIYDFRVTLSQTLLISLEDQTEWLHMKSGTGTSVNSNYMDYIDFDDLQAVIPDAVRIIR